MLFRRIRSGLLPWMAAALLAQAAPVQAQTSTATLSANINTIAKLAISSATVSFSDADPDIVAQVPALGGSLTITAKARATFGSQVVLTVQAADDLRSGVDVIGADAVTWTASGAGFVGGTLSRTAPVAVAQWNGSGVRSGTQTLYFRNLWTYTAGTYTVSLLYTLSAP